MKFTEIEKKIIELIADEYNAETIAQKLKLTTKSVVGYKERLRKKTGSLNSIGVVVYAIKNKIIDIS